MQLASSRVSTGCNECGCCSEAEGDHTGRSPDAMEPVPRLFVGVPPFGQVVVGCSLQVERVERVVEGIFPPIVTPRTPTR